MVFQRLLGSKIDHEDAKVRAKAFAEEGIDQQVLSERLKTETDPDVLCAILQRSQDVQTILDLETSSSVSSIRHQARARLLDLSMSPGPSEEAVWLQVFLEASKSKWAQLNALLDAADPDVGKENFTLAALQVQASINDVRLSQTQLKALALNSQSARVRNEAVAWMTDEQMLSDICALMRDSDKTVYKLAREKLSAYKQAAEKRAEALRLTRACDDLLGLQIVAQSEAVAHSRARLQLIQEQVAALLQGSGESSEFKELEKRVTSVGTEIIPKLDQARTQINLRRELIDTVQSLVQDQQNSPATADEITQLKAKWLAIPDHSATERKQFEQAAETLKNRLDQLAKAQVQLKSVQRQIEGWQEQLNTEDLQKLQRDIPNQWQKLTDRMPDEVTNKLQTDYDALLKLLQGKISNLENTRLQNHEHLTKMFEELHGHIQNGDLKKAISIYDRVKAKLQKAEVSASARADLEKKLKTVHPQLEEFRKWRHFGTQQARENLLGQANSILSNPPASPKVLADEIKALRDAWKNLDRDDGRASDDQWQAFNKVCKDAYKPAKKHFSALSKERKVNAREKQAILDKLNELLTDTDWENPQWTQVYIQYRDMIKEWQKIGPVDYKVKPVIGAAFDEIVAKLDQAFSSKRKAEVMRRTRMIRQLTQKVEDSSIRDCANLAKQMQREWKPSVQSDRQTEQQLWSDFRKICDQIFDQLKQDSAEHRAAWQQERQQRELVCEEVNQLLGEASSPEAINLAKGRVQQIDKEWRQTSSIPKGLKTKLDRSYQQAKKQFEQRLASMEREFATVNTKRLLDLNALCVKYENTIIDGDIEPTVDKLKNDWAGASDASGPLAKALQKKYERLVSAMEGDDNARAQVVDGKNDTMTRRRYLCLLGELIMDLSTPDEYASDRKQLQLSRLKDAMQGSQQPKQQEIKKLIDEWITLGGVGAAEWDQLLRRFEPIVAKIKNGNSKSSSVKNNR